MATKPQFDINTTLSDVLASFQREREDIQTRFDAELAEVTRKESLIRDALSESNNGNNGSNGSKSDERIHRGNGGYQLGISDAKYTKVIEYLRKHGPTRQADLAKSLKLNSGSVSVAMQIAQQKGDASLAGRLNGAKLWEPVEDTTKSETVAKSGEGASKARKVAA